MRHAETAPVADFEPVRVLEVELGEPLPALCRLEAHTGRSYPSAQVLVRLHTHPLGLVHLRWQADVMEPEAYAAQIWEALEPAINAHLRDDELLELTELTAAGVVTPILPRCVEARARFLANAPSVTVVVCTRERPEALTRCLDSLMALVYPRYEVLVVDNAPRTPATADLVRARMAEEPRLRYYREERPGLSRARNSGLRLARGELVAFTDDDVMVDGHWLTELARGFEQAEDVACVTGLVLPAELETPAQVWFEQFGGVTKAHDFRPRRFNLAMRHAQHPLHPYLASQYGAGASMAFKTAALRALGGFDPALGAGTPTCGGEDFDAYFRVITQGYTLVFAPAAVLRHFHRRDLAVLRRHLYGCGVAFTAYLARCILEKPTRVFDLLGRLPPAVSYLFGAHSARNERKRTDFPPDLTRRELWGMLAGPVAYLRSQWLYRADYRSSIPSGLTAREGMRAVIETNDKGYL